MTKSIIKITFISLLFTLALYAATETLDAEGGTATGNQWNTGGTNVGLDCAAQGGTESDIGWGGALLAVPVENSSSSGDISSVQVRVYARSDADLTGTGDGIQVAICEGWSPWHPDPTTDETTTSLAYYSHSWANNPLDDQTWEWTDIDAIEVGCASVGDYDLYVDHVEVVVTYNNAPIITGLSAAANLDSDSEQKTDGSGQVIIDFEVSDDEATVDITLDYWNGSWNSATTTSGFIGTGKDATSSTTARQITWEADTDVPVIEVSNYNVRVTAEDSFAATADVSRSSNDLVIDTKDPSSPACSDPGDDSSPGGPNVTLTSTTSTDANTVSYYFEIDDADPFATAIANSGWQSEDNDWVAAGLTTSQVYSWRVKAKDSYGNETSASTDFAFTVSSVKPSVVIDNASQTSTDGTGEVTVQYDLSDPQTQTCKLTIEYNYDGTWYSAHIKAGSASVGTINNPGEINTISTSPSVSDATFIWDTQNAGNGNGAFTGEDADVYVRITPTDSDLNDGSTVTPSAFTVDNQDPTGYGCSSPADDATNVSIQPTLTSSTASDLSTIQYYFEIDDADPFATAIENSGWQAGETWQTSELNANTTYSWRLNARDSYGNTATVSTDYAFTTSIAVWTYPTSGTIGACTAPAIGDGVVYVGTGGGDDKVYCIDIDDGTLKWSFQAPADVNNVISFYHSGSGKEAVYFTTTDAKINARWDDGSSSSQKFAPDDLGNKTISDLMIDPDGNNLYLGYFNDGYKRSAADGSAVWQTPGGIAPTTSVPVVDNANVYFGAAGNTYKYTVDNTAQGSVAHGADTPLGAWENLLYVALSSDNFVYAVTMSTMTDSWTSANLSGATNTGFFRAFPSGQSSTYNYGYIAAGSAIKKVSCSDGSVLATYAAGNTVSSMPIVTPDVTKVFFGCDDSKAYCVKADLSGDFNVSWPRTVGGPIQVAPAVDLANGIVVFASNEGKVYAFYVP